MSLTWNGDAVQRKAIGAAQFGIDQTMSIAVVRAKDDLFPGHGFITGLLQGSLQMRPAIVRGAVVVGTWGSFTVDYALPVEEGTGSRPGLGYMQGAADAEYPKLAGRIAKEFAR